MKKFIAILICIAMVFALTACGGNSTDIASDSTGSAASEVSSKSDSASNVTSNTSDAVSNAAASSLAASSAAQADNRKPVKIMPLGDSLTEGANHNVCGAYRVPLLKMLDEDGVPYEFVGFHSISSANVTNGQIKHSGKGGATVISTSQEILPKCEGLDPDIVLVMLGTNDTMQGLTGEHFAQYYDNLIIKKLYEMYPDVMIYVATIPPSIIYETQNLDTNNKGQTESNPAIKAMVEKRKSMGFKIELVDMSPEASGITGQDFDEDGKDTVHPALSGNEKIATQWHKAIKAKIAEISAKINK